MVTLHKAEEASTVEEAVIHLSSLPDHIRGKNPLTVYLVVNHGVYV